MSGLLWSACQFTVVAPPVSETPAGLSFGFGTPAGSRRYLIGPVQVATPAVPRQAPPLATTPGGAFVCLAASSPLNSGRSSEIRKLVERVRKDGGKKMHAAGRFRGQVFSPAGAATPFPVDAAAFWRFFTGRPRFAFATGARLAFAVVFAADLSIRKLSRFFPAFTAAAIHLGIAPRPAQVSLQFLGLRYLGATFLPFSLLPAGRPKPEWSACSVYCRPLSTP